MAKIDETGNSVKISNTDMVRIDGFTLCKRIIKNGEVYLQFCDRDNIRASCRGSKFIEIKLVDFYERIKDYGN